MSVFLPFPSTQEVAAVEHQVHLAEAAELKRLEKRNLLESFLLEMQSALRGPKASLLGGTDGEANRRLQEKEHWMLDNQEASESEFEATRKELEDFLHTECAAYFAALQDEKKEQEERLEKGAAEAAAVAAASGGRDDVDVKLPPSQCLKRAKKNKEEANELFKGETPKSTIRLPSGTLPTTTTTSGMSQFLFIFVSRRKHGTRCPALRQGPAVLGQALRLASGRKGGKRFSETLSEPQPGPVLSASRRHRPLRFDV